MPKLKIFKHLATKRKKIHSLQQMSPPSLADANPLVKQQPSASNIQKTISNTPNHFSRTTEAIPTLTQDDGITYDLTGTLSAPIIKQVSNVSWTRNIPSQMQDPQQTSSHSLAAKIPAILIEQVNCRPQKLARQTSTNIKQQRHQYRLCCKCRQTCHLKTHCLQFIEKEH